MSIIISRGKELIRICPTNPQRIEVSTSAGRTWVTRYMGNSTVGKFYDLLDNGKEILGMTDKGLYVSTSEGRTWILRKRN